MNSRRFFGKAIGLLTSSFDLHNHLPAITSFRMSTSTVNLFLRVRNCSDSIFRHCVPKAYYHTSERRMGRRLNRYVSRPSPKHETAPQVSNIAILRRMKEPIERSRRLITELEIMLADHEYSQAVNLARFRSKLAKITAVEPKREWYYDQLGISREEKEAQNSDAKKEHSTEPVIRKIK